MSNKIMCNGRDITEHVARMYDAICDSMDWGSEFLDAEEIQSILVVGKLAGFDTSKSYGYVVAPVPGDPSPKMPDYHDVAAIAAWRPVYEAWCARDKARRLAKWQAQVDAMVAAALGGDE